MFAVVSSFTMTPDGPRDDDVLTAIEVSTVTGGLVAALGVLLRILPVALRWLHRLRRGAVAMITRPAAAGIALP